MRTSRIALATVVLAVAVAPVVSASSGLLVDAGTSSEVAPDEAFMLQALVEGASGPVTVMWTAPEGCTMDDPGALATAASCDMPGLATFGVTATDDVGNAQDSVVMAVVRRSVSTTTASGSVELGLPDEVASSGALDGATTRTPFEVPDGAASADLTLDWASADSDLDLRLETPDGAPYPDTIGATLLAKPERLVVDTPEPGSWVAIVEPKRARAETWTLRIDVAVVEGAVDVPSVAVAGTTASPGDPVTLEAAVEDATDPVELRWEADETSYRFDDGSGPSYAFTFEAPTIVKVKATDANGFEVVALASVSLSGAPPEPPVTVVGVVDDAFTPYHFDFVGHQHPWNLDADPSNDFDFKARPWTYIEGHPGAEAINVRIPVAPDEEVESYRTGLDVVEWGKLSQSNAEQVNLYWFPGTKIVGAARFGLEWYGGNSSHGTRSAASAAGNIHGTCPECVFVLLSGITTEALAWAVSQPWIDVVTNSYGNCLSGCLVRDGVYLDAPTALTRAAAEAGQTIAFSAGNGLGNAFDVPQFTYTSSQKGPDWVVTVGANSPSNDQNYLGAGKPVDISSVGQSYPSTGGTTATGTGEHSGTSNASPVAAGTFARVLQGAREALGDLTSGYANGVVASGAPMACGDAVPSCALGDGTLTRAELWDLVFDNVLPTGEGLPGGNQIPRTEFSYYYQGHGSILGRLRGDGVYRAEWQRMLANARGEVAAYERPAGEKTWFVVDSKCRQKFWGTWEGGYWRAGQPVNADQISDPIAASFNEWCSTLPDGLLGPR